MQLWKSRKTQKKTNLIFKTKVGLNSKISRAKFNKLSENDDHFKNPTRQESKEGAKENE